MATDADLVRHRADGIGHRQQDVLEIGLKLGATEREHRPVRSVHDLDAQSVLGDLEQYLILEAGQLGILVDLVLQLL